MCLSSCYTHVYDSFMICYIASWSQFLPDTSLYGKWCYVNWINALQVLMHFIMFIDMNGTETNNLVWQITHG